MASTDTFARFVEVLASSLDESGVDGDRLARRLHLSRFHVDRIVSAVGGEPPAALRRRVLLERAAHRLLTTDDDVLRVALEAGYASHEAFTRAFGRAFGAPPSSWRRSAFAFRLDGASGVHFHPPAGLRLPAARKESGMELVTRMVEHHAWLLGEMLERAESLSPATLDEGEPTLRATLSRLVGQLDMWVAALEGRPYDFDVEDDESVASMRSRLATAGPAFVSQVRTVTEEARLDETFVDAICDPPEVFTYGGMVAHVLTFAAQRRGAALDALRRAGVDDLSGDPMRWVAA